MSVIKKYDSDSKIKIPKKPFTLTHWLNKKNKYDIPNNNKEPHFNYNLSHSEMMKVFDNKYNKTDITTGINIFDEKNYITETIKPEESLHIENNTNNAIDLVEPNTNKAECDKLFNKLLLTTAKLNLKLNADDDEECSIINEAMRESFYRFCMKNT